MRVSFAALLVSASAALWACDAAPDVAARQIAPPISQTGGASASGGASGGSSLIDPPPGGGMGGEVGDVEPLALTGELQAHDPEVVVTEDGYYLFFTGGLVSTKRSSDLLDWSETGEVFDAAPAWIGERLEQVDDIWAPDVAFFGGEYHLYYAVSTYGTGVSCIGHATTPEVNDAMAWTDEGEIICSDVDEIVDWDAIDPNTFADESGDWWMVFGSYSSGIKLIPLDENGARSGTELYSVASRPEEVAIQAPSMLFREGYYYLFASFDQCCAGVRSTSNIRVGRSANVTGPFVDKDDTPMMEGGGSPFILGNDNYRGAGASSIFEFDQRLFTAYHAYDASLAGQATLRIAPLAFDEEGWPIAHDP